MRAGSIVSVVGIDIYKNVLNKETKMAAEKSEERKLRFYFLESEFTNKV